MDFEMSNGSTNGGVFVIADIPFRDDAQPPLTWSSGRVAAVAPVDVTIGPGVTVTVDAARSSEVLAWTIEDFGDPGMLAAACEPGVDVTALVDQVRTDQTLAATELSLRGRWARKALVAGMSRWLPRPVHEGALILDQAATYQATGNSFAAARLVALASPVLEALAQDCEEGLLSAAAAAELADVAGLAADAVDDLDWGPEVRDYARRIASHIGVSDLDVDLVLLQWRDLLHTSGAVGSLSQPGVSSMVADDDETRIDVAVDPLVVTARIVRWIDADTPEVRVRVSGDDSDAVAELTIDLSDSVDAGCHEVGQLSAYVADTTRGAVLRTMKTYLDGRTLRATLRFQMPESRTVQYGVFDADTGIGRLRTTALDYDIVRVDRMLLDAWSRHRASLAARALADDLARETAADLLAESQQLVSDAYDALEMVIRAASRTDPARVDALTARLQAVEAYRDHLDEHGDHPDATGGPLLAELLPVTTAADHPGAIDEA